MAALATLADVAAKGGVPVDVDEDAPEAVRALSEIAAASAAILTFLEGFDVSEDDVAEWSDNRLAQLASLTAEIACRRLGVSAAPNVDPFVVGGMPQTSKLNRWDKQDLKDLLPPNEDGDMPWMDP